MPTKTISFAKTSGGTSSRGVPSIDGSFDTSDDYDDAISDIDTLYTRGTSGGRTRSSGTSSKNGRVVVDPKKHPKLAQMEQRAVACSKFTMIFVLLLAVTSMATATYLLISRDEQNDFEVQVRLSYYSPSVKLFSVIFFFCLKPVFRL